MCNTPSIGALVILVPLLEVLLSSRIASQQIDGEIIVLTYRSWMCQSQSHGVASENLHSSVYFYVACVAAGGDVPRKLLHPQPNIPPQLLLGDVTGPLLHCRSGHSGYASRCLGGWVGGTEGGAMISLVAVSLSVSYCVGGEGGRFVVLGKENTGRRGYGLYALTTGIVVV